jgi:hypothetical protein
MRIRKARKRKRKVLKREKFRTSVCSKTRQLRLYYLVKVSSERLHHILGFSKVDIKSLQSDQVPVSEKSET